MPAALFLSREELVELTGYRAPSAQVGWLERNRWRFVLTHRNEPRVAREHFNERMGCPTAVSLPNTFNPLVEPDFAALDRL